jgi:hypothetical protein
LSLLLASAALIAWACGTDRTVGSRFVKSELVSAARGGTISVSAGEEPQLAGTRLTVPAGALSADTQLTLELGRAAIAASPRGPVAVWGPSGTTFATPARLTLPVALQGPEEAALLEISVEEADGSRFVIPSSELTVDVGAGLVSFPVKGFTRFQPGTTLRADGGANGTAGGNPGTAGGNAGTAGGNAGTAGGNAGTAGGNAGTAGGNAGTAGGPAGTGGGSAGGGSGAAGGSGGGGLLGMPDAGVRPCANASMCLQGERCVMSAPGIVGYCAP